MEEKFDVMEILRKESYQFRNLEESHHKLEASLVNLTSRKILSQKEEIQKKTFQKEKLAAKDTMNRIMQHYRKTGKVDFKTG